MLSMRRLRKFMAGNLGATEPPRFDQHKHIFYHAEWLVRLFYIFNLFLVYQWMLPTWKKGLEEPTLSLLWPVGWIEFTGPTLGSALILHLSIIAVIAAIFFWQKRIVRVFVFFRSGYRCQPQFDSALAGNR